MSSLEDMSFPLSRLGDAIEALARRSRLAPRAVEPPAPPEQLAGQGEEALARWIDSTAAWLAVEAEPVESAYADLDRLLRGAGPAVLRLPAPDGPRFVALLKSGRVKAALIGPDLEAHQVDLDRLREALTRDLEAPLLPEVDRLLNQAHVPARRRQRARAAILRERLGHARIGGWLLRLHPGARTWELARQARLPRLLVTFVGAHALQYFLWIASWVLIGRGALQGRLDPGWLLAWLLLLLTLVPLRMWVAWTEGRLAVAAGALVKQRLLYGALRLEPDEIRHQGVGQLLGRVFESEAVESLALNGGFLTILGAIELLVALAILAAGAGGVSHTLLLIAWIALTSFWTWRFYRQRSNWTDGRLTMTHDLVERMVGHRTRLAQEAPERWHDGEDRALARYLGLSREMDRAALPLMVLAPRGWVILGFLALTPAFVSGSASSAAIAVGVGGVLSAYWALRKLAGGALHLASAVVAWRQVALLFQAATRPQVSGLPAYTQVSRAAPSDADTREPILDAHELVFGYSDRGEPILRGCSLQIREGDRVLLEGPSGSGKSTLAHLLTGLRVADSGLILLRGLDRQTVGGDGWRRRVVAAPQFHENHVLTETFAFNLLMGRHWPPRPGDMQEAEALCRELGLGALLQRMPAGLLQMVGESGWQLSHGERSRLYIARALLQKTDLVILDESFAALDPETLSQTLQCVLRRAPTLLVIAHP